MTRLRNASQPNTSASQPNTSASMPGTSTTSASCKGWEWANIQMPGRSPEPTTPKIWLVTPWTISSGVAGRGAEARAWVTISSVRAYISHWPIM